MDESRSSRPCESCVRLVDCCCQCHSAREFVNGGAVLSCGSGRRSSKIGKKGHFTGRLSKAVGLATADAGPGRERRATTMMLPTARLRVARVTTPPGVQVELIAKRVQRSFRIKIGAAIGGGPVSMGRAATLSRLSIPKPFGSHRSSCGDPETARTIWRAFFPNDVNCSDTGLSAFDRQKLVGIRQKEGSWFMTA